MPKRFGIARGRSRWLVAAAAGLALALLGSIPIPMVVTARAELSAIGTQFVYAPSDGVVTEIAVRHGQSVRRGDVLMTIIDRDLDEKIEVLLGQRAVLLERAAELNSSLADPSQRRREDPARVEAEQQVIDQQRASIDRQVAMLTEQRRSLTLLSDRDGIVDGWQVERHLADRPVHVGQSLLSVIEPDKGWQVEAFIPQTRLDHVQRMAALTQAPNGDLASDQDPPSREYLTARLVLQSHPEQTFSATLVEIGPTITVHPDEGPVARARFAIAATDLPTLQTGAPARVAIDCGRHPVAYVAFQDFIRTVRGAIGMYL